MEKEINKVFKRCIDCPYFSDCEGEISCKNLWRTIERKDFEIIEKGFPSWCTLDNFKEGKKMDTSKAIEWVKSVLDNEGLKPNKDSKGVIECLKRGEKSEHILDSLKSAKCKGDRALEADFKALIETIEEEYNK